METGSVQDCLVCQEQRGDIPVPGGHLIADDSVVAFHLPPSTDSPRVYQGYLFVTSRRHAPGFADLDDNEAAAVGQTITRLSRALRSLGAERVYVAVIESGVPHLHMHLLPRWPETPPEVRWIDVDTWEGARRGGFEETERFTAKIAKQLTS